jgi:hypothetical protein
MATGKQIRTIATIIVVLCLGPATTALGQCDGFGAVPGLCPAGLGVLPFPPATPPEVLIEIRDLQFRRAMLYQSLNDLFLGADPDRERILAVHREIKELSALLDEKIVLWRLSNLPASGNASIYLFDPGYGVSGGCCSSGMLADAWAPNFGPGYWRFAAPVSPGRLRLAQPAASADVAPR